ncbi:MAG TPA: hypothetical protein VGM76_08130 [Lacipirellulaceae bacterium]
MSATRDDRRYTAVTELAGCFPTDRPHDPHGPHNPSPPPANSPFVDHRQGVTYIFGDSPARILPSDDAPSRRPVCQRLAAETLNQL